MIIFQFLPIIQQINNQSTSAIYSMLDSEIEDIQIKKLLSKLTSHTQYLSHIKHYLNSPPLITKLNQSDTLSLYSVFKSVVQVAYLIYTAYLFKIDIYLEKIPCFHVHFGSDHELSIMLRFFLGREKSNERIRLSITEQNRFTSIKSTMSTEQINSLTVQIIKQIIRSVEGKIQGKSSRQLEGKKALQYFNREIQVQIGPRIKHEFTQKAIKMLEATEVFNRFCDLLKIKKNSLYFKIKTCPILYGQLRAYCEGYYLIPEESLISQAKFIDESIVLIMEKGLLFMEKSSTKDYKDSQGLSVGYIQKGSPQKPLYQYICKFFSVEEGCDCRSESSTDEQSLNKRIHYLIQYSYDKRQIQCSIITSLEAKPEIIDILSTIMHNFLFGDHVVTVEVKQMVIHTSKGHICKDYIAFKGNYFLEMNEHPMIPLFNLIEIVTVQCLIYYPMFLRKPKGVLHNDFEDTKKRVEHAKNIFVSQSENFYNNLLKIKYK